MMFITKDKEEDRPNNHDMNVFEVENYIYGVVDAAVKNIDQANAY
jgi:hypothetical protein